MSPTRDDGEHIVFGLVHIHICVGISLGWQSGASKLLIFGNYVNCSFYILGERMSTSTG